MILFDRSINFQTRDGMTGLLGDKILLKPVCIKQVADEISARMVP